jgi:hypothetical protein
VQAVRDVVILIILQVVKVHLTAQLLPLAELLAEHQDAMQEVALRVVTVVIMAA